jgi:outer membrane lipoprotein-sorting protein
MTVAQRRRRWLVPPLVLFVVVLVAWAPSLFAQDAGTPSLAPLSTAELVAKAQAANVQTLSGTMQVSAQLGLPDLGGLGGGGSSPLMTLLSGTHTLGIARDGPERARVALTLPSAEDDLIRNGSDSWLWESSSQTVVHVQSSADPGGSSQTPDTETQLGMTPMQLAQNFLDRIDPSTTVSVGTPSYVADRPVYNLVVGPRSTDSTIGHVVIAVDASTGLPLDVQVFAKGGSNPALEVGFTSLSLSRPDGSVFAFAPPPGAKVVESSNAADLFGGIADRGHDGLDLSQATLTSLGSDWDSVAVVAHVDLGQRLGEIFDGATHVTLASGVTGRVISTALVNVLVLDDQRVLIGAVTAKALEAAAVP